MNKSPQHNQQAEQKQYESEINSFNIFEYIVNFKLRLLIHTR